MHSELHKLLLDNEPDYSKLAGGARLPNNIPSFNFNQNVSVINRKTHIDYINNFLSHEDCDNLIKFIEKNGYYAPVTIQGMQEVTPENIGSKRITAFSPELAEIFHQHLYFNNLIEEVRYCMYHTPTDWFDSDEDIINVQKKDSIDWEFVGVSPMLRFMKYENGGKHFPHYDAAFKYQNSDYKTLKSFVLYLTTNETGTTRFIKDYFNLILPAWERTYDDWDREPRKDEIFLQVPPKKGDMLVFDHRICHDVSEFQPENVNEVRIIIRGDLIYKRIRYDN